MTDYRNNHVQLIYDAHTIALNHGWHDRQAAPTVERCLSLIALIHSEIVEAAADGMYSDGIYDLQAIYSYEEQHGMPVPKPVGLLSEYADVLIRLADMYGYMRWDSAFVDAAPVETDAWVSYPPFELIERGLGAALPELHGMIANSYTEQLRRHVLVPNDSTDATFTIFSQSKPMLVYSFAAVVYALEELARCAYASWLRGGGKQAALVNQFGCDSDALFWRAVREKMEYNKHRPYRHGGKAA